MGTVLAVVLPLVMIALGVLLIHLLNAQHSERIAAFHYGRSWTTARGPAPSVPRKAGGPAGPSGTDDRRDHRDGGRGRFRPRRRTRKGAG